MRIGDPVELRRGKLVLGRAHIAEIAEPDHVVIKAVPRLLPTGTVTAPKDRLVPKPDGGWVLHLG